MEKDVIKIYKEHKIFYTKLNSIKDFFFTLLSKVEDTYFGDSIMSIQNKKEHFQYCLNKTRQMYTNIGFNLNPSVELDSYLFNIFFKHFYDAKKTKKNIEDVKIKYTNIFSYDLGVTPSQLNEMVKIYDFFNINLGDI